MIVDEEESAEQALDRYGRVIQFSIGFFLVLIGLAGLLSS